jgi:cytochrome c553
MKVLFPAVALGVACLAGVALSRPPAEHWPGVPNLQRSEENYMLQCRGCHRPDGGGSPDTTPRLAGQVASFLKVEGGRQYLGQVPGIATAPLSDAELAELLNWTLYRFDRGNLPRDFVAYTASEVARLRRMPLRIEAPHVRARLVAKINDISNPGRGTM